MIVKDAFHFHLLGICLVIELLVLLWRVVEVVVVGASPPLNHSWNAVILNVVVVVVVVDVVVVGASTPLNHSWNAVALNVVVVDVVVGVGFLVDVVNSGVEVDNVVVVVRLKTGA